MDRAIRVVGGAALVVVGLTVLDALDGTFFGIVVSAFGIWFVLTGAIGFCPLYVLLGIDTLPRQRPTTRFATPNDVPVAPRSREPLPR